MTWEYEEKAWANGYGSVCGVDEAGRGPVAGPVCAAAVILPAGIVIEGLNDSKKLSEKKREKLFDEITENALAWSVFARGRAGDRRDQYPAGDLPRDEAGRGRPDRVRRTSCMWTAIVHRASSCRTSAWSPAMQKSRLLRQRPLSPR